MRKIKGKKEGRAGEPLGHDAGLIPVKAKTGRRLAKKTLRLQPVL